MSQHGEHRERLEEFLAGIDPRGVDPWREFEGSELGRCSECRGEVRDHLRCLQDLGELAEFEAGMMAEAASLDLEPGNAEAVLRSHVLQIHGPAAHGVGSHGLGGAHGETTQESSGDPAARGAARKYRVRVLVLAASMLLLVGLWRSKGSGGDDRGQRMGPGERLLSPIGQVDRYAPFRWDVALPPGGHFVVTLHVEGEELRSPWLYGQSWTPEASVEVSVEGAAELGWQLEVFDASNAQDPTGSFVEWAHR